MSSADHHDHDASHDGPIKTPTQLLVTVFFSFVIPVFVIIGLVYYVSSAAKPAGDAEELALGGITVEELNKTVNTRIQKVGVVEIRDASSPLKTGEEVYKAQCVNCHGAGAVGSPKFGDAAAWGPRIATGYAALLTSALKGKGNMGAQGGGDYDDLEVGRALVYMTNAAGGKLPVPERTAPAAVAAASAASAPAVQ
jgi:cytochrome c5